MPVSTPDKAVYERIDSSLSGRKRVGKTSARQRADRPLIGISANSNGTLGSCINRAYSDSILLSGGIPILLPITDNPIDIEAYLDNIDGLLMSGGSDISPYYMGENTTRGLTETDPERDRYDLMLVRRAVERNIPILGICKGHQVIAVAFGGKLHQDIYRGRKEETLLHNPPIPVSSPAHTVRLTDGESVLRDLFGTDEFWVNSLHHQAVSAIPTGFIVTAVSPDGINEAMEAYPEKSVLSVQWHPEQMFANGDLKAEGCLFHHLVREALLYKKARSLHRHTIVLDSHVDTPMLFDTEDFDFICGNSRALVDLPKMQDGLVDAVQMAVYLPQDSLSDEGYAKAEAFTLDRLHKIRAIVASAPDKFSLGFTVEGICLAKSRGLRTIIPAIENGYAIGYDLSLLRTYKELGVTYITLCHNGDNDICDSASASTETHNGLSPFGRTVVQEMNRLGLMIDVSHAADSSIREVLAETRAPIVASHSSCRALCDHPRNLSDDLIQAIAKQGGIVQICLYSGFLRKEGEATVTDAVDHIEHVIRLTGYEHVGIGSDFDGGGGIAGCRSSNDLIRLSMELLRRGHSPSALRKIWGRNWLRVMQQVQEVGRLTGFDDL